MTERAGLRPLWLRPARIECSRGFWENDTIDTNHREQDCDKFVRSWKILAISSSSLEWICLPWCGPVTFVPILDLSKECHDKKIQVKIWCMWFLCQALVHKKPMIPSSLSNYVPVSWGLPCANWSCHFFRRGCYHAGSDKKLRLRYHIR